MQSTLALLAQPHESAMPLIVQDALVPGVNVTDLVINAPTVGAGLEMHAGIYISASAYSNPQWPYFGSAELTYTRLDMGDALGHIPFVLAFEPPFSSMQVAERLSEALGIQFDPVDIFQELHTFSGTSFTMKLKAGPLSRRWVGEVDVLIRRLYIPDIPDQVDLILPGFARPSQVYTHLDRLDLSPPPPQVIGYLDSVEQIPMPSQMDDSLDGYSWMALRKELEGLDYPELTLAFQDLMDGFDYVELKPIEIEVPAPIMNTLDGFEYITITYGD